MNEQLASTRKFIVEEAKKAAARALIWAVLAVLIFTLTPLWTQIKATWRASEDIAAIRNDLHAVQEAISDLRADVARASGEDRVIRQIPGLSYVAEPVVRGGPVVLYLVAQRTRLGAQCRLIETTPLFTDYTGITTPGNPIPGARQITTEPTRLRLVLTQPPNLQAGRIELHLALDYDCNGVRTHDRTDTVVYTLIERTDP
jgi:hypothetical protein